MSAESRFFQLRWFLTICTIMLAGAICTGQAIGQVGQSTKGYWEWVEPSPAFEAAMVAVESNEFDDGRQVIGGAVIAEMDGQRVVLTVAHCLFVQDVDNEKVPIIDELLPGVQLRFSDGTVTPVKRENIDAWLDLDLAVVRLDVPKDLSALPVASQAAKPGDTIFVMGYGGSEKRPLLRHFRTRAAFATCDLFIITDAPVIFGDSGGAILNADDEICGLIKAGHKEIPYRSFAEGDRRIDVYWPGLGMSIDCLKEAMQSKADE